LQSVGESVNLAAILKDIEARDARDMGREVAPLKAAADAVIIDSTDMSIAAVKETIVNLMQQRQLMP
jgi:cytidylate kinase